MAEGEALEEILREMREVREQEAERERQRDREREATQQRSIITPWVDGGGEPKREPVEIHWQHPTLGELRFVRAPAKVWVVLSCRDWHDEYRVEGVFADMAAAARKVDAVVRGDGARRCFVDEHTVGEP